MSGAVIVVSNLAGGSGKSTGALSIAAAAAEYGKNVLLVDADPAATCTFITGVENPRITTLEIANGSFSYELASIKSAERFNLIPSASRSFGLDGDWDWLKTAAEQCDLVIIDTPTGPSQVLSGLMNVATHLLIPLENSFLSLRGALNSKDFLPALGPTPMVWVLPNKCDGLDPELYEVAEGIGKIMEPAIRADSAVVESQISLRSVLAAAPQSPAASDYREVTYSILEQLGIF